MKRWAGMLFSLLAVVCVCSCTGPRITLFPDGTDPLKEVTLEGSATEKILMIPISGVIDDAPESRLLRTTPGMLQEVVSLLRLAEKDDRVKAVLLKIDSPGGSVTASDTLYHEIAAFKARSAKKVVVCMMSLATSGGYYISLPADLILAHPTTVTGSVGVILMRPDVTGLMDRVGVAVEVNKSGENKDMGSPFRAATTSEDHMLQELTDTLGRRFVELVKQHRKLDDDRLKAIADARIFLADAALETGLIDGIGYLSDAIAAAKQIAELDPEARVVTYRRSEYADDNIYNPLTSSAGSDPTALVDLGSIGGLFALDTGFYYIWPQAIGSP